MIAPRTAAPLTLTLDQAVIDQIGREFGLRQHNREGLRELIVALTGDYEPSTPLVMDMCTGSGKTYLMAGLIEYLRRQGIRHVMVVTPSKVVQSKTVQNFTPGTRRYIAGSAVEPQVTTPQDYSAWRTAQASPTGQLFGAEEAVQLFVFNIQQLIAPKELEGETSGGGVQATQRRIRRVDESAGNLYDYLQQQEDLVVIADESHLYGSQAKAFHQAVRDLHPAASVGLTASAGPRDHVVYRYPLYRAIAEMMVKTPVIAYRESGYPEEGGEELQLRDALTLLATKQAAYEAHAAVNPGGKRVNAVLFVVCADVQHATQIASLLRSPAYLGSDDAVLQVDNEHEDAVTLQRLEDIDQARSTVRAVVSVNKLKEGWDVRSIAVMVTLRAMVSEVLTQQTIGRGLRLPFGEYTGHRTIDTLDVLSHASFKKMLSSEQILKEFGLEKAVPPAARRVDLTTPATGTQWTGTSHDGTGDSGTADDIGRPGGTWGELTDRGEAVVVPLTDQPDTQSDGNPERDGFLDHSTAAWSVATPAVTAVLLDDDADLGGMHIPVPDVVQLQDKFARVSGFSVAFPSVTMERSVEPFTVSMVDRDDIRRAAERITDAGDVIARDEIVINRLKRRITTRATQQANVESVPMDADEVEAALVAAGGAVQAVPRTAANVTTIRRYLVPELMNQARIDNWTVKSAASAVGRLEDLLRESVRNHQARARTVSTVIPVRVPSTPSFSLPLGETVHEPVDARADFVRRRWYGGWDRSLLTAARFDSFSGEYALAQKLDISPDIVWWLRLEPRDRASIAYTPRNAYHPDFLALDTDGVHWIVEGKNDAGAQDETVQLKRAAAERHVVDLLGVESFDEQTWGYLIAYESEVERAGSWKDLVASSNPVVTP
ncbi:DEAD/DEAH box helicase family protein [Citricoccus sp. NPDC079358]|uniref:DEAD/DEAH box helicase n=1 Tax=Citricoccus sp. NPDC079358 TaxID=3154653 RepID=UPI00344E9C88